MSSISPIDESNPTAEPGAGKEATDYPEAGTSRRVFLGYVAGAISGFIGIVTGVPIVGYLVSPLGKQEAARWVNLGKVDDFKSTEPRFVTFSITRRDGWTEVQESRACWVVPQGNNAFVVFNGRCTHLGCAYSWRVSGEHAEKFFCPCHDGIYDREGRVLDGPPPRPLDRLEVKVEDNNLMVLYQDFRLGAETKEPL